MKVEINRNSVIVTREATDRKIYKESLFYYLAAKELKKQGHDVVKKLMYKDGHMVSDNQYYIRERKWKWSAYDNYFALRFVYERYNKENSVELQYIKWGE